MNLGTHHTPETRLKISAAKRGTLPWHTGKQWSNDVKAQISATKKANPLTRIISGLNGKQGVSSKHTDATSKFHGVSWDRTKQLWFTKIYLHAGKGGTKFVGYYPTAKAGARAWDNAVRELGLDRPLNFPESV
jgi:NUMOD3 motif